MNKKINGTIKWYNKIKKEGYIIGIDEEKYYFDLLSQEDINEIFESNDEVLFIPIFENEIPYAEKVEKIKN